MKKNVKIFIIVVVVALVAIAILRLLIQQLRFVVVSVDPALDQSISIFQPITLTLNKPLDQRIIDRCQAQTQPEQSISIQYQENAIQVAPEAPYQPQTQYQLQITCPDFTQTLDFITVSVDELSETDIGRLQTIRDFDTASSIKQVFEENPWRAKLPITTDEYILVYSQVEDAYLVTLTLKPNQSFDQTQIEAKIKTELTKIGAPELDIIYR